MSKIVTVANQKGGAGKTTVTNNLGKYYAKKGLKVLLIDYDPQGSLSYTMTGNSDAPLGLSEIFSDFLFDREPNLDSLVPIEVCDNLSIYTANSKLGALVRSDPFLVQTRFKEFVALKAKDYDLVLVDCPPTLSTLLISALLASTGVFIPTYADDLTSDAMKSLMLRMNEIKNMNSQIKVYGMALIRIEEGTKEVEKIKFLLNRQYGKSLLKSTTRFSVKYKETIKPANVNKDIIQIAGKKSVLAKEFTNLAEELLGRVGVRKKAKNKVKAIKASGKNVIKATNRKKKKISGAA